MSAMDIQRRRFVVKAKDNEMGDGEGTCEKPLAVWKRPVSVGQVGNLPVVFEHFAGCQPAPLAFRDGLMRPPHLSN